jgi:tetratricopeptide (TPR) repeat protein
MLPTVVEQALRTALAHHRAGRLAEAEALYRQVPADTAAHPDALHMLGVLACQEGRFDEAIARIARAIALRPTCAEFHSNLGEAFRRAGRRDAALECLERALELAPELAVAHNSRGIVLREQGRLDEAAAAYCRALGVQPEYAEAWVNLGHALCELARPAEAIEAYRRAATLAPGLAGVHVRLGALLKEQGRLDEAVAAYERALTMAPDDAATENNLGLVLKEQGRLDEAVGAYRRALRIDSGLAAAHNNLASALLEQGSVGPAIDALRRALEVKPDYAAAASNLLFTLHYNPASQPESLLAEHRAWAARFAAPLAGEIQPHANDRSRGRRLRVGIVSPDFRGHPVGQSLLQLFRHRDPGATNLVAYSDVRRGDVITEQLRALADEWNETAGFDDRALAEKVRADAIDILVDPRSTRRTTACSSSPASRRRCR